jgi:hypothetical protein
MVGRSFAIAKYRETAAACLVSRDLPAAADRCKSLPTSIFTFSENTYMTTSSPD